MKKLITIILAMAMLLPAVALADLPDVAAFTDQELRDLITAASAELLARNTAEPDGILIFEKDGIKLYQTGEPTLSSEYMHIPVAVYNDTDFEMNVSPENAKINGWEVYSGGIVVGAKARKKGDIAFNIANADVTELGQIDSLRFSWLVFNQETWERPYEGEEEEYRFW